MGLLEVIDQAIGIVELDEAMADNAEVIHAVMEKTEEAREFWVSYFEAFDHPWSREHQLRSGYVERPGDYVKGIRIRYMKTAEGLTMGRITATDYKSHWIEFGSRHMPPFAPRAATVAHFGGAGKAISS
jgi:hypothetical protein